MKTQHRDTLKVYHANAIVLEQLEKKTYEVHQTTRCNNLTYRLAPNTT